MIKKAKNTVPLTYVIGDLKGKEIVGTFYLKELQKTNQKEFKIEKVIKRKNNKLNDVGDKRNILNEKDMITCLIAG